MQTPLCHCNISIRLHGLTSSRGRRRHRAGGDHPRARLAPEEEKCGKKKVLSGDLMCYRSQTLLSQPCGGQEHGQGCVGTFATSPVITWSHFGCSGDEVPPGWVLGVPAKLTDGAQHIQSPPESRVWDGMGARGSCRQPRAISLPHDCSRARSLRWSLEHLLGGLVGAATSTKVPKTCGQREVTKEHPKPPHPSMGQARNFGDALADGLCIPKLTLQSAEIPRSKALLANTIQTQPSSQLRADYSEIKFFF